MSTEQEQVTVENHTVKPGTLLKAKREALGLTQKQVADRLRLRLSIIQNLEENHFPDGQVATFTRGYLRSYAKAVGIKESEILAAFEDSYPAIPREQPMQSFSKKTKREKHDSRIMTLTWGIFAILIGISSLWWWQNQQQETELLEQNEPIVSVLDQDMASVPVDRATDGQFTTASELMSETDSNEDVVSDPQVDIQTAELISSSEEDMVDPESNVVEAQEEPISASNPENTSQVDIGFSPLSLSFNADCWIQIKDASGKTLSTGIKKAGQTVTLTGEAPLQIILGAPESVSMTFASEPVDLSGYTSGKVARFTLP
ncbi:cytoskeleton protein RodZ [Vibrio aestuarianus]|uniref:Cytoskeleton protein RodZ n=2 Tax=Vibrio aestuarianus TaxID=28171 RepID=A0A9X4FJR7_9VIBR|nr:cytoskeleton protein RodZ [Vibrio aestuarianus]MDE1356695.1 cytoskeleton protein RodZ [Vibrio aestuarianus]NGZ16447.1 cytoskeleton protein RodZ [Vibrio aestuarianus]